MINYRHIQSVLSHAIVLQALFDDVLQLRFPDLLCFLYSVVTTHCILHVNLILSIISDVCAVVSGDYCTFIQIIVSYPGSPPCCSRFS